MDASHYHDWYNENRLIYDELTKVIRDHIKKMLKNEGLEKAKDFVLVTSRVKKWKSFRQKMIKEDKKGERKYSSPIQITDIAGARIVGFVLSDLDRLSSLIKQYFNIDYEKSIVKSERLESNKIGYRSSHMCVNSTFSS
jgi:putative GTP pyrophosphokinase